MKMDVMTVTGDVIATADITGVLFKAAHHGFVNHDMIDMPCTGRGVPRRFALYDLAGKLRSPGVVRYEYEVGPETILRFSPGELEVELLE